MKKNYAKPKLKVFGNVEKITLAAGATNSDADVGTASSAFPTRG
jgi:hypothetical protein